MFLNKYYKKVFVHFVISPKNAITITEVTNSTNIKEICKNRNIKMIYTKNIKKC